MRDRRNIERRLVTYEDVHELFNYDKDTGELTWKVQINPRAPVGKDAGYVNGRGYRVVKIFGTMYPVHRIIFLFVEGFFPEFEVDHINRVRTDNRWCNLRHVTINCNKYNRVRSRTVLGKINGVSLKKGRKGTPYEVYITINRTYYYLGTYNNLLEAACHRYAAEQCLGIDYMLTHESSAYLYLKQQGIVK